MIRQDFAGNLPGTQFRPTPKGNQIPLVGGEAGDNISLSFRRYIITKEPDRINAQIIGELHHDGRFRRTQAVAVIADCLFRYSEIRGDGGI